MFKFTNWLKYNTKVALCQNNNYTLFDITEIHAILYKTIYMAIKLIGVSHQRNPNFLLCKENTRDFVSKYGHVFTEHGDSTNVMLFEGFMSPLSHTTSRPMYNLRALEMQQWLLANKLSTSFTGYDYTLTDENTRVIYLTGLLEIFLPFTHEFIDTEIPQTVALAISLTTKQRVPCKLNDNLLAITEQLLKFAPQFLAINQANHEETIAKAEDLARYFENVWVITGAAHSLMMKRRKPEYELDILKNSLTEYEYAKMLVLQSIALEDVPAMLTEILTV